MALGNLVATSSCTSCRPYLPELVKGFGFNLLTLCREFIGLESCYWFATDAHVAHAFRCYEKGGQWASPGRFHLHSSPRHIL
jgi:hypothetical protein